MIPSILTGPSVWVLNIRPKIMILYVSFMDHRYSTRSHTLSTNVLWEKKTAHVMNPILFLILRTTINTKQAINNLSRKLITKTIYCQAQDDVKIEQSSFPSFPLELFACVLLAGRLGEKPNLINLFHCALPQPSLTGLTKACDWGHPHIHHNNNCIISEIMPFSKLVLNFLTRELNAPVSF